MSISLHSKLQCDEFHKLLELTPDLLSILQDEKQRNSLHFKAQDDDSAAVVLCSDDRTWLLREKMHSNTVMLMREFVPDEIVPVEKIALFGAKPPKLDLLGYSRTTSEYETKLRQGVLNLHEIPVYNGELEFNKDTSRYKIRTEEELLEISPCSRGEFEKIWTDIGGCSVNGFMCILSSEFLSKALHVILISAMAETLDLTDLSVEAAFQAVEKNMDQGDNALFTKAVIKSVIHKFATPNDGKPMKDCNSWNFNMKAVAQWYGIKALKTYLSNKSMAKGEFLIKWKSTFPPFLPCDIDVNLLRGWYFQPTPNRMQYLSKDTLPIDVKDRFALLFKMQLQWDLDDIKPFIEEYNVKKMKLDNFIMKYARRKKVGNKVIVMSR